MGRLGRRVTAGALLAASIVLGLGLAAGAVRLLPWLLAPEVPLEVALPFARALGALATEAALLIGMPIGAALALASFVERGEARALFALGASPARLVLGLAPPMLLLGVVAGACSLGWGSSADVPGRFAVDLLEQGRASCARATAPKSAEVPLVGVTWLCFPGQPPRVAGALPGLHGSAWFTARDFVPSDDLREASFADLRVFTKKLDDQHVLELSVKTASVRGLPGWGRSAKLPFATRSALSLCTAVLLALASAFVVLSLGLARRAAALVAGGLPAVAAFVTLSRIDGSALSAGAYFLVPVVGLAVLGLASAATSVDLGAFRRRLGRR